MPSLERTLVARRDSLFVFHVLLVFFFEFASHRFTFDDHRIGVGVLRIAKKENLNEPFWRSMRVNFDPVAA